MIGRPGIPSLLREINDRAALELLLTEGPLIRAQVGEGTGLSKVTASQTLTRGPSAAVYAIVSSTTIVAGLDVAPEAVTTGVADVTGRVLAEVTVDPNGVGDPVQLVRNAVAAACRAARIEAAQLRAVVIGTGGMVDPRTETCGCR
jgi:hypothetical protein